MTAPLIDIVNSHIDLTTKDLQSARILGLCTHAISKRDSSEWAARVDLGSWTRKTLDNWAWSAEVLTGLVAIAQARFVVFNVIRCLRRF